MHAARARNGNRPAAAEQADSRSRTTARIPSPPPPPGRDPDYRHDQPAGPALIRRRFERSRLAERRLAREKCGRRGAGGDGHLYLVPDIL